MRRPAVDDFVAEVGGSEEGRTRVVNALETEIRPVDWDGPATGAGAIPGGGEQHGNLMEHHPVAAVRRRHRYA